MNDAIANFAALFFESTWADTAELGLFDKLDGCTFRADLLPLFPCGDMVPTPTAVEVKVGVA